MNLSSSSSVIRQCLNLFSKSPGAVGHACLTNTLSSTSSKSLDNKRSVSTEAAEDEEVDTSQAQHSMKFMSRERYRTASVPFQRQPIYFPDIKLEMMKLEDWKLQQIEELGWTREVAFKTTPNVTKLEVKAFLESVYGMQVEKVSTINYLGRKHITYGRQSRPKRYLWREADWKKAYVLFRPPKGVDPAQLTSPMKPGEKLDMIDQLRKARGLPPRQKPTDS